MSPSHDDAALHAFVFVDHTQTDIATVLNDLFKLHNNGSPRVHWAGSFVGDYIAFAHVVVDDKNDLAGLQDFIEGPLWKAGLRCRWATEVGVAPNLLGTKRATPEIIALVGIKTQHGRAEGVLEKLMDVPGFKGASLVTGDLDIVLQLGGEMLEDVQGSLLSDEFTSIEHIVSTSTAVADGSRGPFGRS